MLPILDPQVASLPLLDALAALARGGAAWVEYRDKRATHAEAHERAGQLAGACRDLGLILIVNDRVDVALAVGAGGVHLGQDDLPAEAARRLLGASAVVGISVDTADEARRADALPVDYIAVGPVFATTSKRDAGPVIGLAGLAAVRVATRKPLVGIGGIDAGNASSVLAAGCDGVAVLSGLYGDAGPQVAMRELLGVAAPGFGDAGN